MKSPELVYFQVSLCLRIDEPAVVITVEMKPRQVQGRILRELSPSHSASARAETHNAHGVHYWRAPLMTDQVPQAALPVTQMCPWQSAEGFLHGIMHEH